MTENVSKHPEKIHCLALSGRLPQKMETWGCERSGENRHAKIATTPKISDVNHADRDMTMDCRTEEYFKGVLQKFVPIVDFEPSVKTVEATEKFESFVTKHEER